MNRTTDQKRTVTHHLVILVVCLCVLCIQGAAVADDIKQRMAARIPAITALKNSGSVGENNKGFLEFRGAPSQQDLVDAENRDRSAVYAAIAAQQKVSPVLVGQRRAAQIAAKGAPGQLFQRPDGSWYKK